MDMLNADFDFSQADPRHLFAFSRPPRREPFRAGDRLYRFTSLPSATFEGSELFRSPWWYAQRTFNSVVRTANRTGASVVDTARSRLAVSKEWNPTMEWLAIIELTKPAYGWVGPTRAQPLKHGDPSVILVGNYEQVYMPRLAGDGDGRSSPFAFVSYYGSMVWV